MAAAAVAAVLGLLKERGRGYSSITFPLFGLAVTVATVTAIAVNEVSPATRMMGKKGWMRQPIHFPTKASKQDLQKIYGQWEDDRRVLLGRDRVKGLQSESRRRITMHLKELDKSKLA